MIISLKKVFLLFGFLMCIFWFCDESRTQSQVDLLFETSSTNLEVTISKRNQDNHLEPPNTNIHENKNDLRSSYLMQYQPHHFVIQNGFKLPMNRLILPIQFMIRQKWMEDLRNYLYEINRNDSSPINIVSSDFQYKDILFNWLVSATVKTQPPLHHVLVLSLDQPMHTLLLEHDIASVYIDPQAFIRPTVITLLNNSSRRAFRTVMIMRLVVMRLINHWGYDVANYDTDAIILRNPTQLFYGKFNDSDIVGSKGRFPEEIKDILGVTMCAGVYMVKSTPNTEIFWNILSTLSKYTDDQMALNKVLSTMNLNHTFTEDEVWVGRNADKFTVTILPQIYICRRECKRRKKNLYYVWHNGGKYSEGKIKYAKVNGLWYLREEDWAENSNNNATGLQWLVEMSN